MKFLKNILGLKEDYKWLFFRNEFFALIGKSYNRFSRLLVILFITFLALSFAKGSYNYLSDKMNDPFTNWVNVPIETDMYRTKRDSLKKFFKSEENRKDFQLNSITGYVIDNPFFYSKNNVLVAQRGRTIAPGSELLAKILGSENVLWIKDKSLVNNKDLNSDYFYDIIVTEEFLNRLDYKLVDEVLKVRSEYQENKIDIWLNVLAVVKNIPNESQLLFFPNLFNSIYKLSTYKDDDTKMFRQFFDDESGNQFQMLSSEPNLEKFENDLIANLDSLANKVDRGSTEQKEFVITKTQKLYLYKVFFNDGFYNNNQLVSLHKQLNKILPETFNHHYLPFNKYNTQEKIFKPYYFAFNFNKLDNIRKFKNFMKNRYQIEVEMSQVESKENFAFVSALTLTISFVLFTLGLMSIIIYLVNLLKTHLNSIKTNLGTYKAFGLNNNTLQSIYIKIILSILAIGVIITFIVLIILQQTGIVELLLSSVMTGLDHTINCLSVFNFWNLFAIILVIGITMYIAFSSINKILSKTPGDLIYGR